MTDQFDRTHGSTGTQPPDGKEFQQDERPDEAEFDWFWYNVHTKINSLVQEVTDIINGNITVSNAQMAENAKNVTQTYKENDIDSDGDGIVDKSDQTVRFQVRNNDPNSPEDGEVWIRSDL